jgi:hypothetical protein
VVALGMLGGGSDNGWKDGRVVVVLLWWHGPGARPRGGGGVALRGVAPQVYLIPSWSILWWLASVMVTTVLD